MRKYFRILLLFALLVILPVTSFAKESKRIYGKDRYVTALEISKQYVTETERVIVVSGEVYPDAISASALSAQQGYPILLSKKNEVSEDVKKEIQRVKAKEILLVGGKSTISQKVEEELSTVSKVKRLAGKDRYKTSLELFEYKKMLDPKSKKVFLASGRNFVDALVAAPYIYKEGSIVLYDEGCGIDINKYKPELIFGGPTSLPGFDKVQRIYGRDRYETSVKLAEKFNSKTVVFASGYDYPDALAGALVASRENAPIILVKKDEISKSVLDNVKENKFEKAIFLGGVDSISDDTLNSLDNLLYEDKIVKPTEETGKTPKLDKSELEKALLKAKELLKADMSLEGKKALESEIKKAEEVLKRAKNQKEIDKAVEDLMQGIKDVDKKLHVEIEDPLFKKVLNKNISLEREDDASITMEEMESLKEISIFLDKDGKPTFAENFDYSILGTPRNLSGTKDFKFAVSRGIKSIKGIEYAKNLEKLKVNENEISDINPLKGLIKLKYLEIQRNRIVDISPLKDLKNLEFLKLYNNLIEDVTPLAGLTNLTGLDLHYNVTVEGDEYNKIISKGITDISPLKDLKKLEYLDISANRIEDVSIVKDFPNLLDLDFTGNRVNDYTGLGEFIAERLPRQYAGFGSIGFSSQGVTVDEELKYTENPVSFANPYKGFNELGKALQESFEMDEEVNILENLEPDVPGINASYDKENNKIDINIDNNVLLENKGKEILVNINVNFIGIFEWKIKDIRIQVGEDISYLDEDVESFYRDLFNKYSKFDKKYVNLTDEANKKFSSSEKPISGSIEPEDFLMLKRFVVSDRNVTDKLVKPLKDAINLEEFEVQLNDGVLKREITDFSFLNKMPNLTKFWYANLDYENATKDRIGSIDFSNSQKVDWIQISGTNLKDLSGFSKINPRTLSIQDNEIEDISDLSDMTNLVRLDLDNNKISNIDGKLDKLQDLVTLYLRNNPVENISSLGKLSNLEALHLRKTKVKDIESLKSLEKLHRLYIDENSLDPDYFEVVNSFKGLNGIYVDEISMEDFDWLKENSIRSLDSPEAKNEEDQVRMAAFKDLNVELRVDKNSLKDRTLTIENPIVDWEKNAVIQTSEDENYNPIDTNTNLEFKDDKIIINISDKSVEEGKIEESYYIYMEHPQLVFGEYQQPASIFGKVTLNIGFAEIVEPELEFESDGVTPIKYDLRQEDGVTEVRNQYKDGACRSFSSLAALESFYKKSTGKEIDLSENNFETRQGLVFNNKNKTDQPRSGRMRNSDFGYLISGKGPILETEDPYRPFSVEGMDIPNSIDENLYRNALSNNGPVKAEASLRVMGFEFLKDISNATIESPEDSNLLQIKTAIRKHGAVSSNIYMSHDGLNRFPYQNDKCFNSQTNAYFTDGKDGKYKGANHAIAIVGWDDSYSKDNFVERNRPTIDGEWLVKDAQGKDFGDGGYFYVSFQSKDIGGEPYVFTIVEESKAFDGIYHHDEMPFSGFISSNKYADKTVLLNAYDANKGEELKEIAFYTTKRDAEFEIYLIEDFDSFEMEAMDITDDEDYEELLEQYKIYDNIMDKGKGHIYAGYHTISLDELNKTVKFDSDKKFALGIWIRNKDEEGPNHQWDMVVENTSPNGSGRYGEVKEGQTFTYSFGMFVDIGKIEKINACIEGYYLKH